MYVLIDAEQRVCVGLRPGMSGLMWDLLVKLMSPSVRAKEVWS
jgi:hypothetical protein